MKKPLAELMPEAMGSYNRQCGEDVCKATIPAPTHKDFLRGNTVCPDCGTVYDIDDEDRNFVIAYLMCVVEGLERRTRNPFEGLGL